MNRLRLSANVHRVAANAVSLLASDVINRATTFGLYALVARSLGAFEFGQLSLALTLFYTFQILAVAGLKTLVTREIAKDRARTDELLVNGSVVVLATALASFAVLALFVRLMGYDVSTSSVVLLLAAGLIPYAVSAICEAVFQGWERMRLIAIANIPVNVIKISLAFALLKTGLGLDWVIGLLVGSYVIIVVIEWVLILTRITVPQIALRWGVSVWLARSTLTFLGIDGIIAITGSLNVILLSKFRGETEVGLYNAGTQLMVPVSLIYASIVISVFPLMCRRYEPTLQGIKRIGERVIELILSIALPTTVGLFLLSGTAIELLYGSGLSRAELSLQIMVWGLILSAMTSILGQVLVASLRERVTLRIVAVDLIVSVTVGVPLIWQFGFAGAAITAVTTRAVDLVLHYRPVANLFSPRVLLDSAWKPVLSTGVLIVVYFEMAQHGDAIAVVGSALAYLAALSGLTLVHGGGPRNVKRRYAYLWPEQGNSPR